MLNVLNPEETLSVRPILNASSLSFWHFAVTVLVLVVLAVIPPADLDQSPVVPRLDLDQSPVVPRLGLDQSPVNPLNPFLTPGPTFALSPFGK